MTSSTSDYTKYLQNFEIYIGDDPEWANNPKCPGGPFMNINDLTSYNYNSFKGAHDWVHGKEIWCNMEGRYTTLVADFT